MSEKLRQGFLSDLALPASATRWLLNVWLPFRGAGIWVEHISADYRCARVRMRHGLLNSNIFGTHFGGSLFAMTDPFYALLLLRNLGPDYVVWDKAAVIDFKLPAKGTVRATFSIDEAQLNDIRQMTQSGEKYEPTYCVDIIDARRQIVATVAKTLYVRRKPTAVDRTSS